MRIENGEIIELSDLEAKAQGLLWDYASGISVDASDEVRMELAKFASVYDLANENEERLLRAEKDYIKTVSEILEKELNQNEN